jgi:hypothetical protein
MKVDILIEGLEAGVKLPKITVRIISFLGEIYIGYFTNKSISFIVELSLLCEPTYRKLVVRMSMRGTGCVLNAGIASSHTSCQLCFPFHYVAGGRPFSDLLLHYKT